MFSTLADTHTELLRSRRSQGTTTFVSMRNLDSMNDLTICFDKTTEESQDRNDDRGESHVGE